MKFVKIVIYYIALALPIFAIEPVNSQREVEEFSSSLVQKFEGLPDDKAYDFWVDHLDPVIAAQQMMDSALANRRTEFLRLAMANISTIDLLFQGIQRIQAPSDRDNIIPFILRCDSDYWPENMQEEMTDGSRGVSNFHAIEPFRETLRSHIPGLTIKDELLSTKAKRLELAVAIERSLSSHGLRPMKRGDIKTISSSVSIDDTQSSVRERKTKSFIENQSLSPLRKISFFAICLIFLSAWLLIMRRCKSKTSTLTTTRISRRP